MLPHNTSTVPALTMRRRFLSASEAADLLGKRTSTLSAWRSAGIGPAFVKIGGSVRYLEADLEAFIAAGRCAPSPRVA